MAKSLPITRAVLADPVRYSIEAKRTFAWESVEKLARSAKSEMVRLLACREFLDRLDPKDNALALTGPIVLRWATEEEAPSFVTVPARSNGHFTNGSAHNGHALPSSSVIDGLASL